GGRLRITEQTAHLRIGDGGTATARTPGPERHVPGEHMTGSAFREITQAQLLPRVVRLGPNLYGAVFMLMKLVPAWYILRKARERGEIGPHTVVVETTSGTFGLALAMQTALWRQRFVLVSDPVIDANLYRRLT